MSRPWMASLFGFLSACGPTLTPPVEVPAGPGVHATLRKHLYRIEGATTAELSNEIRAKGPEDAGARRTAYTDVTLKYRWTSTPSGGGCRPDGIVVDAEIIETLPEWEGEARASAETQQEWSRFLSAVETHENGHLKIGIDTALAITSGIAALGTLPSCDDVDRQAERLGADLVAKMKERQRAYDAENDHGATTGAVLTVQ